MVDRSYETKRPLQLCWLATSGTQEGRIAHHHTDATVLRKRSGKAERRTSWLYLVPFLGGKDTSSFYNFQIFRLFFLFRQFFIKSLEVSNNYRNFAAGIKERIKLWHQLHLKIVHAMK